MVLAIETGGRWSDEIMNFFSALASVRSRDAPQALQRPAFLAWRRRWTRMLAVSCSRAFATSLTRANAAGSNSVVLVKARRDKEAKYAEFVDGPRCYLVVLAIETGGRWSDESMNFISASASARSRDPPQALQRPAFWAWRRPWTRMLAVSCSRAFATSLTSVGAALDGVDGITPDLADVFES